ncbi:MAG: hypothetical protein ACR2NR_12355 [Solirubrobacteraceae bacterium]
MKPRRWMWLAATGLLVVVAAAIVVLASGGGAPATRGRSTRSSPTVPAGPPQRPALAAPAGQQPFGANVNRLFNDLSYSPAQIDAQLRALQATGATVARSDALWQASEPQPPRGGVHRYVWSFDDQIATALAVHGLTWLPILDYSPPWAQSIAGQPHSPPRDDADFAAYAAAFAGRYGTGGTFWRTHPALPALAAATIEVWNAPDNGEFWAPSPSAAGYAEMYLASRAAIDSTDPTARVIVGGLTAPATFLPAMQAAAPALAGHVDGVAIHPYGSPAVVVSKVRAARATLAALGMAAVPLYVTEFGWTTSPPAALDYVSAAQRPEWIERTLASLGHLDCGLAATVLYTWVTPDGDPANSQDWYGIEGPDAVATPSSAAFTAGLRAAAAPATAPLACSS